MTITIEEDCGELYVPNAFSPDGDGNNDILWVRGRCITKLHMDVYDRWGTLVFTSDDQAKGWEGNRSEKSEVRSEIYVYHLSVTFKNGTEKVLHGNVSLLR